MKYGLILSGGSGTRLWPYSRSQSPKQFLKLGNPQYSLLQETFLRLNRDIDQDKVWTISNQKYAQELQEQFDELGKGVDEKQYLFEPEAKNTAPAILWAALALQEMDPEAIMAVMPSDHIIKDQEAFHQALELAFQQAEAGYLVTFGIKPTFPETGFGYIQMGKEIAPGAHRVANFKEKPNLQTAITYFQNQNYVWNSGMFVFPVTSLLKSFQKLVPRLWSVFQQAKEGHSSWKDPLVAKKAFSWAESISIDYAIMERSDNIVVIPCDIAWNDLGSWEAMHQSGNRDENNNILKGDVITLDTHNSLVYSSKKLITTIGLDDVIVVETQDSILICNMKRSQDVKKIVEQLKEAGRPEI